MARFINWYTNRLNVSMRLPKSLGELQNKMATVKKAILLTHRCSFLVLAKHIYKKLNLQSYNLQVLYLYLSLLIA